MHIGQNDSRIWQDLKVSHLYTTAITSPYDPVRREAMKVLGALVRIGNDEAARALDEIKRRLGHL
jgi:hypothetical protein